MSDYFILESVKFFAGGYKPNSSYGRYFHKLLSQFLHGYRWELKMEKCQIISFWRV